MQEFTAIKATKRALLEILRCPNCLGELEGVEKILLCSRCKSEFSCENGIPILRKQDDVYYGEFSRQDMVDFLNAAADDLDASLRTLLRQTESPRRLGEYIMGSARAGWQFLLSVGKNATVLDFGCGWGTLAYSLARVSGKVVAMDTTLERMRLLKIRAEAEQIFNVKFVSAGDGKHLPFEADSFDAVVINGVLEWLPSGIPGDPHEIQTRYIQEVRRILKPGGAVYLGIENRYAWKTWFRQKDGHTGLRFVPWLPRPLASLYSILNGNGRYRNYLYGRGGYARLLRQSGFNRVSFYVTLPGYHHPTSIIPADDKAQISKAIKRPAKSSWSQRKQALKGFLSATYPDAFGIIASERGSTSYLSRLLDYIEEEYGLKIPEHRHYRMNGEMGMTTILFRGGEGKSSFVLKLPLHERANRELVGEVRLLGRIKRGEDGIGALSEYTPSILGAGHYDGQPYAVIELLPGVSGDQFLSRREQKRAVVNASEFSGRILAGLRSGELVTKISDLEELCAKVESLASDATQTRAVLRARELVASYLSKQNDPTTCLGHGDFKLANLLFNPESLRVCGVIDWGGAHLEELIAYDLQFLLAGFHSSVTRQSIAQVLRNWVCKNELHPELHLPVRRFEELTGWVYTPEAWQGLAAYQWLKRLAPLSGPYEARRFDFRYLDEMFGVFA